MHTLISITNRFLQDETGVTSIEYALLASLIALVIVGSVTGLGQIVGDFYSHLAECVASPKTCT